MRKSGWLLCLKYEPCTKPEYIYKLKGKDIHVPVQHVVQIKWHYPKKANYFKQTGIFFQFCTFWVYFAR